jgi:hypothetical protein
MQQVSLLIINRKRAFLLAVFMCLNLIAFSQQDKKVSGTVTSLSSNSALPGVSILVHLN